MKRSPLLSMSLLVLLAGGLVAGAAEPSVELDVVAAVGGKAEARLKLPMATTLFETRRADRVLVRLSAGHEVVVLAMDAHGLKVQAHGPHGPLRGWVSRKLATGENPAANTALENWYRRELAVAALADRRQAALNLTAAEMERIFGAPTRRTLALPQGGQGPRVENLEWIRTEKLELDKTLGGGILGLDKNSPLARPEIETGRLTAECRDGVVVSLDGTLEPGTPAAATEIPAPLPCPFAVIPTAPTPTARRAGD